MQLLEAADEETGSDQQHDRQGDLGEHQWGIAFFDGTASVVKPVEINLPSGTLTLRAQAIVADGIDLDDFSFDDVQDVVTAVSADAVDFVN